ncbi:hypothetical protein Drorol1_Dr00025054 [Drosera rotundifolia]
MVWYLSRAFFDMNWARLDGSVVGRDALALPFFLLARVSDDFGVLEYRDLGTPTLGCRPKDNVLARDVWL